MLIEVGLAFNNNIYIIYNNIHLLTYILYIYNIYIILVLLLYYLIISYYYAGNLTMDYGKFNMLILVQANLVLRSKSVNLSRVFRLEL